MRAARLFSDLVIHLLTATKTWRHVGVFCGCGRGMPGLGFDGFFLESVIKSSLSTRQFCLFSYGADDSLTHSPPSMMEKQKKEMDIESYYQKGIEFSHFISSFCFSRRWLYSCLY
jgi:hypothetical protein